MKDTAIAYIKNRIQENTKCIAVNIVTDDLETETYFDILLLYSNEHQEQIQKKINTGLLNFKNYADLEPVVSMLLDNKKEWKAGRIDIKNIVMPKLNKAKK